LSKTSSALASGAGVCELLGPEQWVAFLSFLFSFLALSLGELAGLAPVEAGGAILETARAVLLRARSSSRIPSDGHDCFLVFAGSEEFKTSVPCCGKHVRVIFGSVVRLGISPLSGSSSPRPQRLSLSLSLFLSLHARARAHTRTHVESIHLIRRLPANLERIQGLIRNGFPRPRFLSAIPNPRCQRV
jgi:hypothetical protein